MVEELLGKALISCKNDNRKARSENFFVDSWLRYLIFRDTGRPMSVNSEGDSNVIKETLCPSRIKSRMSVMVDDSQPPLMEEIFLTRNEKCGYIIIAKEDKECCPQ